MNVDGAPGPIILCREVPGSDPDHGCSNRLRQQNDQAYHEARERTERRAAEEATSPQSSGYTKSWQMRIRLSRDARPGRGGTDAFKR